MPIAAGPKTSQINTDYVTMKMSPSHLMMRDGQTVPRPDTISLASIVDQVEMALITLTNFAVVKWVWVKLDKAD